MNEGSIIFWNLAALFFVWSFNRLFVVERVGSTPYVARYGRECPHLNRSYPFGCLAITHHKGHLPKFGPRAYEGLLVGYSGDSDAYVVLDLEAFLIKNGKIKLMITRDAKIKGNQFPLSFVIYIGLFT